MSCAVAPRTACVAPLNCPPEDLERFVCASRCRGAFRIDGRCEAKRGNIPFLAIPGIHGESAIFGGRPPTPALAL